MGMEQLFPSKDESLGTVVVKSRMALTNQIKLALSIALHLEQNSVDFALISNMIIHHETLKRLVTNKTGNVNGLLLKHSR